MLRGGVALWEVRLTRNSVIKKLYSHCLTLIGSRNRFERDFTIELI